MFVLKNGILTMDNHDLDHIKGWVDDDFRSPKEALALELNGSGLDILDVKKIELTSEQKLNKDYLELYKNITL